MPPNGKITNATIRFSRASPTQPVDHKLGEPDTHPVGTIRAIKDDAVAHIGPLSLCACQ